MEEGHEEETNGNGTGKVMEYSNLNKNVAKWKIDFTLLE